MPLIPHLPILENRLAQFAAKFEALPQGGYAWHRNDWSDGLPVSAEEHAGLLLAHYAAIQRVQRVLRWWIPVFLVLIVAAVIATHGTVDNRVGGALAVLPLPWVFWTIGRAERVPLALVKGRHPVRPPRGFAEGAASRLAALPVSVPLMMCGVGALLLGRLWWDGTLLSDLGYAAMGLGVFVFGVVILLLRRR